MAEEKPRILKVLEALSQCVDPTKPADIGNMIGETPFNTGHDLFELEKSGMAEKPDKEKSLYLITDRGRETLENPPDKWVYKSRREPPPPTPPPAAPPGAPPGTSPEEITVPSQADLFMSIGERLGVGARKGDVKLEALMYYVQRTADLDNLTTIWNALTEMGVANDVKKRWIKLYAQTIPSKEIPEELREKLEIGESERIKTEAGEISAKPKRFSIVGGEIIGDSEGDLNFKEALQLLAQQRGAPTEAVNPLATMIEAMKMGPDMATATLTALIPLITKEPPKQGGEGDLLSKLDSLGLLKKTSGGEGEKPSWLSDPAEFIKMIRDIGDEGKGDDAVKSELAGLRKSLEDMKDERHKQEMASLQGQILQIQKSHEGQMREILDKMEDIKKPTTGKSEMDIISDVATGVLGEAKGLRGDLKEVIRDKGLPPTKTTEQKEERKGKYRQAIETDQEIEKIGRRMFMGEG